MVNENEYTIQASSEYVEFTSSVYNDKKLNLLCKIGKICFNAKVEGNNKNEYLYEVKKECFKGKNIPAEVSKWCETIWKMTFEVNNQNNELAYFINKKVSFKEQAKLLDCGSFKNKAKILKTMQKLGRFLKNVNSVTNKCKICKEKISEDSNYFVVRAWRYFETWPHLIEKHDLAPIYLIKNGWRYIGDDFLKAFK